LLSSPLSIDFTRGLCFEPGAFVTMSQKFHCERITKAEKEVIDRTLSLHLGENPPETRMYIRVNKKFSQHRSQILKDL
jgi:hypothetical protein